jgi:hypothetical protein
MFSNQYSKSRNLFFQIRAVYNVKFSRNPFFQKKKSNKSKPNRK